MMQRDEINSTPFEEYCERTARKFVKTMVFMDDQAGYETPTIPHQITTTPAKGILGRSKRIRQTNDDNYEVNGGKLNRQSHPLNVAELLESAMRNGLVCCVHKPVVDKDFQLENLNAIINADIVCFDWIMKQDDNGETTTGLIKEVILKDTKVGGRHRLIAIYTFKTEIVDILEIVKTALAREKIECHLDADAMCLSGKYFRILGLLKSGGTQLKELQVSAGELPAKLVKEFSKFNQGLIPSLTMASIGILRDSTAHVLAKLNSKLDGPFLTHKTLLGNPEDATSYASEIVASELKEIIHKHKISNESLSEEVINSYIESKKPISLKYLDGDTESTAEIDLEIFKKLINDGIVSISEEIEKIPIQLDGASTTDKKKICSVLIQNLSSVLTGAHKEAKQNNLEFLNVTKIASDLSSQIYKSEIQGGHGKTPTLQLGTIVKNNGNYLLCLQPSCDSVRVGINGQPFLFLRLNKEAQKPMLVIRDGDKLEGLSYKTNTKNSLFIRFKQTDSQSETVTAEREGNKLLFKIKPEKKGDADIKYQWMAELKMDMARKIGQELSNQYSRIGLDEFELSRIGWDYQIE